MWARRQGTHIGISPSTIRPSLHTMDDQRNSGLSPGAIQKIKELKALMNKYPQRHIPDGIIRLAIFNSINGDNSLDQMLDVASRYGTAL